MVQSPPRTNPFPGLRPFELDEEHLFFGREGQADELLRRLNRTRFLAVVGTSGSGKSSLVRAGLLPSLYSGFLPEASSGWRVAILRPGNAPIANLAAALNQADVFGIDPASDDAIIRTALTESTLRRGALGLVEVTQQARMEAHESLLVVVDQFEELFRFKAQAAQKLAAEDEAAAFVKLLLGAVNQRPVPIFVVLTMRSDFLGDCAQFRDLPEALNDSQYLIPRLTRNQLQKTIEGPIKIAGGKISNNLVNQLLNEVGDDPDQLPILQHAMMRTWDFWRETQDEEIDPKHYNAIGSMSQALSRHADELFLGSSDSVSTDQKSNKDRSREQLIIKVIFDTLTEVNKDRQLIRRPTSLRDIRKNIEKERINRLAFEKKKMSEYGASYFGIPSYLKSELSLQEIINQINEFRGSGKSFLMPSEGSLDEDVILDISHESIIRKWKRLGDWKREETIQILRKEIIGDSSGKLLPDCLTHLRNPLISRRRLCPKAP
ncbi:MAG: AAA family ATPase [Nodosilinea sp.]